MQWTYEDALAFADVVQLKPPLSILRGRPFRAEVVFRGRDLTGSTNRRAQIRAFPGATGAELASVTIAAPYLINGTDTVFVFSLDAGATGGLPPPPSPYQALTLYFDCVATVAGSLETLCASFVTVAGAITQ